jgi:transglutaminase-like putative cysteine protease
MQANSNSLTRYRAQIPDGAAGTRATLKQMRELVRRGKDTQELRHLANSICMAAQVPAKDWRGELAAIFDYVQTNIRYSQDPSDIETIQGARETLQLGYGDCDDFSVLIATLAECLGHPCCLVALGFQQPGTYEHVMTMCSGAGEDCWVGMDATEARPLGWFPKGVICEMVAPVSETAAAILAVRTW